MSRHKIIDAIAVIFLAIFMVAIFFLPSLKEAFLQALCVPEFALMKKASCTFGYLLLYMIPFVSVCWLVIRLSTKITKFASLVSPDSQLCKGIGKLYQKIKVLDG